MFILQMEMGASVHNKLPYGTLSRYLISATADQPHLVHYESGPVIAICCVVCLRLSDGSNTEFKQALVNTSMQTQHRI